MWHATKLMTVSCPHHKAVILHCFNPTTLYRPPGNLGIFMHLERGWFYGVNTGSVCIISAEVKMLPGVSPTMQQKPMLQILYSLCHIPHMSRALQCHQSICYCNLMVISSLLISEKCVWDPEYIPATFQFYLVLLANWSEHESRIPPRLAQVKTNWIVLCNEQEPP